MRNFTDFFPFSETQSGVIFQHPAYFPKMHSHNYFFFTEDDLKTILPYFYADVRRVVTQLE